MKRIEKSKKQLEESFNATFSENKMFLVFQELMNYLPTYEEKKELSAFYEKAKRERKRIS